MWKVSGEPPGPKEVREAYEQIRAKESMLRWKQSVKRNEENMKESIRLYDEIISKARLTLRSKETASPLTDSPSADVPSISKTEETSFEATEEAIDDISQAKTPKARSSLLQKKLAENRKTFERRTKEIIETKRVVEEKVQAIRQQLEENSHSVTETSDEQPPVIPITPLMITTEGALPNINLLDLQEKENEIMKLNNKILELEATVVDLQENLKEKDSVIDSKVKAVTLLSADLSKKGKTTLDTLEDTKDEMRTMQEHFVLLESSLRNKNESLLQQLQDRDNKISELEDELNRYNQQLNEQKLAELASADFSRSTMDTLVETKDAMKGMQENFVLIETSLKSKIDNLMQQLQDREVKLEEATEKICRLESAMDQESVSKIIDLQENFDKLNKSYLALQDENNVLKQNISEMQNDISVKDSLRDTEGLKEKDNRIAELEEMILELKKDKSHDELQVQIIELTSKNEEYLQKIGDLEKSLHDLEEDKSNATKSHEENITFVESEKIQKLTQELDDLNKSMIKMKAQHRSKMKNLQKQLESFKNVSDVNLELVRLGNQVALLEEEKGNLQLSLVDFDEIKASAGDMQGRLNDLEKKVAAQATEIKMHVDAIAALEDQKLDLMQELHAVKQEVSTLEAENAESENLRVTAEMKVVDLEEQLESLHKSQNLEKTSTSAEEVQVELVRGIRDLTEESNELRGKLKKIEEKNASDSGSTESFENIQEGDRNELLRKIDDLTKKNQELLLKLSKSDEKGDSNADSTESFETINDPDRSDLSKTQESSDLTLKLSRIDEKGSSDTGSTESFERISGHNENLSKIELLTQENSDLVIKVTKLEEKLEHMRDIRDEISSDSTDASSNACKSVAQLVQENKDLTNQLTKLRTELTERHESERRDSNKFVESAQRVERTIPDDKQLEMLSKEKEDLEEKLKKLQCALADGLRDFEGHDFDVDNVRARIDSILEENMRMVDRIAKLDESNVAMQRSLEQLTEENNELKARLDQMIESEEFAKERVEVIKKLKELNRQKDSGVAHAEGGLEKEQPTVVAALEVEIQRCIKSIEEQNNRVEEMKIKLAEKDEELHIKAKQLAEYDSSTNGQLESLQRELKDSLRTIEEWQFKCDNMQEKIDALVNEKEHIEESLKALEEENKRLVEEAFNKESETNVYKEEMEGIIRSLESKLHEATETSSMRENEVLELKEALENKDRELQTAFTQLKDQMISIVSLQDELSNCKLELMEKNGTIDSLTKELEELNASLRTYDEELAASREEIRALYEKLKETKPLSDYNELLEKLDEMEASANQMTNKIDESARENEELSNKIENMAHRISDLQAELSQKEDDMSDLIAMKTSMGARIDEIEDARNASEKRVWELQESLEKNTVYADNLRAELNDGYRMLELLKAKHNEDMEMQNRRLEDLLEDANAKAKENEHLKNLIEEKDRLIGRNVTEEVKAALEAKINDLESKLIDLENREQLQSEKAKKAAAALKNKTAACQELEARVAELEEKWTTEKDEKEAKNKKIQEAETRMREKDVKIADLEERLSRVQEENTEALSRLEKLTMEEAGLKEEMDVLKKRFEEAQEESARFRAEAERKSVELDDEKSAKDNAITEIGRLTDEGNALKEDAAMLRKRLEETEEEIDRLRVESNEKSAHIAREIDRTQNLVAEVDRLTNVEIELREELSTSTKRIAEVEQEIGQLRSTVEQQASALAEEKLSRQNILEEYETYKERTAKENEQRQGIFEEVKENARELNVRMQVMETEYVQQLALIKNLKTENSLLLSKHAQINEKLENVEKTSEDRRLLIEQLQKEAEKCTTETTTQSTSTEEDAREETTTLASTTIRPLGALHCEHCDQCQTLVQALEAKLQEREAEIENLDNELANSIGNFVQMRESLRYSDLMNNQSLRQNRTLEDPYNDLLLQYNALSSDYEETKTKLQIALRENEELTAKISDLESVNATSREQIAGAEESLRSEKEACLRRIAELETELERVTREGKAHQVPSQVVEDSAPRLFDASQIFGAAPAQAESLFESNRDESTAADSSTGEKLRVRRDAEETRTYPESVAGIDMAVDLDDDGWGGDWAEIETPDQHPTDVPQPGRNAEAELRAKINELQAQIDILEAEKQQVAEENKATQIRCTKLTKMLKEYKAQIDTLQQKVKESKKTSGDLFGLDSAIEEALQTRIAELEKALKDAADERKRILAEKDILLNRLEVITSANERYMEGKEKQDRVIETLRMENKEFASKIETLERRLREPEQENNTAATTPVIAEVTKIETKPLTAVDSDVSSEKLKAELDDLKEEMEALAAENEQLQRLLEEQIVEITSLKTRAVSDEAKLHNLEELNNKSAELQNALDESNAKYDQLEKEYQQNMASFNERLAAATREFESEVSLLQQRLSESDAKAYNLQTELESVLAEKADLEVRTTSYAATEEKLQKVERSLMEVTELLNARVQEVADLRQELQRQYLIREEIEKRAEETIGQLNQAQMDWQEALSRSQQNVEKQQQEHSMEIQKYVTEANDLRSRLEEATKRIEELSSVLSEKDVILLSLEEELMKREANEHLKEELQKVTDVSNLLRSELESSRAEIERVQRELAEKEIILSEKEAQLAESIAKRSVENSGGDVKRSSISFVEGERPRDSTRIVDGLPVFTMAGDNGSGDARDLIEKYKLQVDEQQQEIEHLKHVLSENTYPQMLQEMQDAMNVVYNEKAQLESSLRDATQSLTEKHREVESLKRQIERQEDPRTRHETQEEIVRLQNEVHAKEQEINDLRYVIAEKDAQLNFRASSEPSSDEFQLRDTVQTLTNELYNKDRDIQRLESEIVQLRGEVTRLREFEALMNEARDARALLEQALQEKELEWESARQKLFSEVEKFAEELRSKENQVGNLRTQLESVSTEKERILEELRLKENYLELSKTNRDAVSAENEKLLEDVRARESHLEDLMGKLENLSAENQKLLAEVHAREKHIEDFRMQLENLSVESNEKLQQKEDQLAHTLDDLAEKERRLAELSITKDAELHDLKVRIHEKEVRIEELITLSEEEEKQLDDLRKSLDSKEKEVNALKERLENKIQEYDLIRSSLKKDVSGDGANPSAEGESSSSSSSNELDLALYMLHQRDVRCEELTHELMQLLEERDTLQLRLSNAIKINEELRRSLPSDFSPLKSSPAHSSREESTTQEPSQSKAEGPVEIAKEAIHDTSVGEDKEALAQKLSQLHMVGHTKDVRLRDERELRHNQQMSLYAHKDVLSSLPPEAAAKLVNANYTLSRDVQSQSSVLLNWLWGKSTPKVVHM